MVTEPDYIDNGKYMSARTYYGLSTDTKPLLCGNGSIFIEIDTGIGYLFDAVGQEWHSTSGGE